MGQKMDEARTGITDEEFEFFISLNAVNTREKNCLGWFGDISRSDGMQIRKWKM